MPVTTDGKNRLYTGDEVVEMLADADKRESLQLSRDARDPIAGGGSMSPERRRDLLALCGVDADAVAKARKEGKAWEDRQLRQRGHIA